MKRNVNIIEKKNNQIGTVIRASAACKDMALNRIELKPKVYRKLVKKVEEKDNVLDKLAKTKTNVTLERQNGPSEAPLPVPLRPVELKIMNREDRVFM